MAGTPRARSRRPRPGHAGDRQRRFLNEHGRRRAPDGPGVRRRRRARRDAGGRPHPRNAGGDVSGLALLEHPLRRRARLENLPEESVEGLLAYAAAPVEDVALVLVHGGGQKGSGVLTKLRKLKPVTESKSGELKASEYSGFVAAEVPATARRSTEEAAGFLVQAVGQDLRSLAAAADQLTNDFPGGRGRRRSSSTSVAARRRSRSRWPTRRSGGARRWRSRRCAGRSTPVPPPMVTSAFAGGAGGWPVQGGAARDAGRRPGKGGGRSPVENSARSGTSHAVGRTPGSRG